jgi:hypothetical protein
MEERMSTRSMRRTAAAGLLAAALAAGCKKQQAPSPTPTPVAVPTEAPTTTLPAPTAPPTPPLVWRTVRWGMSTKDVLAALPGEAQRLPRALDFAQPQPGATVTAGKSDVGIPSYEADGTAFRVLFGFEADALNRIHLSASKPTAVTCEDQEKALTQKYGKPAQRNRTGTSLRGDEIVWKASDATVYLSCAGVASLGFMTVSEDYMPPTAANP